MTSKEQCCDDRFEIINETKQYIINATNIETSPEEMNVLDSICFRLWQLGLTKRNKDKLKELTHQPNLSDCIKEWEERGFAYENNDKRIYFANEKENILIYIQKELKDVTISVFHYNYAQTISFDLHNLIHKTLKALEKMEDE